MARSGAIDMLAMAVPESKGSDKFNIKNRQKVFNDLRRRRIPLAKALVEQHGEGASARNSAVYALHSVGHSSRTIPGYPDYIDDLSKTYGGFDRLVNRVEYELETISGSMRKAFFTSVITMSIMVVSIIGTIRYSFMNPSLFHVVPAALFCVMILVPVLTEMNSGQGRLKMMLEKTAGPPVRDVEDTLKEVRKWRA